MPGGTCDRPRNGAVCCGPRACVIARAAAWRTGHCAGARMSTRRWGACVGMCMSYAKKDLGRGKRSGGRQQLAAVGGGRRSYRVCSRSKDQGRRSRRPGILMDFLWISRYSPLKPSTAHRGGGVPSVKSYVTVCSNPLVHGGRRASSHWLLLAPTPTDPRVGLRSSFQAHGFLPSTTQTNVVSAEGGWAKRYATPAVKVWCCQWFWKYVVLDA